VDYKGSDIRHHTDSITTDRTLSIISMSGSSELPVAPLPLTSKHRDELDQVILERISEFLDEIPDPIHIGIIMALKDWMCISIITDTIRETIHVLERENLKNVLRTDINMMNQQKLQQHPQLRDMVREACLTRSNFTHIADLSECLCAR